MAAASKAIIVDKDGDGDIDLDDIFGQGEGSEPSALEKMAREAAAAREEAASKAEAEEREVLARAATRRKRREAIEEEAKQAEMERKAEILWLQQHPEVALERQREAAAIVIQKHGRGSNVRYTLRVLGELATVVQKCGRGMMARNRIRPMRRAYQEKQRRRQKAATVIQSAQRRRHIRQTIQSLRSLTIFVQARGRGYLTRKQLREDRERVEAANRGLIGRARRASIEARETIEETIETLAAEQRSTLDAFSLPRCVAARRPQATGEDADEAPRGDPRLCGLACGLANSRKEAPPRAQSLTDSGAKAKGRTRPPDPPLIEFISAFV
tara:strand:- start:365 stop:1345 length:981 start_codon:yes stop_codon:yes gene_type:complete